MWRRLCRPQCRWSRRLRADASSSLKWSEFEMRCGSTIRNLIAAGALIASANMTAWSQPAAPRLGPGDNVPNVRPAILAKVGIDQRLGQQVPLDLSFVDENGQAVQL